MQRGELNKIIKKIDSAKKSRNQSFFITLFLYLYKLERMCLRQEWFVALCVQLCSDDMWRVALFAAALSPGEEK